MTSTNTRIWLSAAQAAERAGRHVVTVRGALAAGDMHGYQRSPAANWRIHVDCVDAWIAGTPCEHRAAETAPLSLVTT